MTGQTIDFIKCSHYCRGLDRVDDFPKGNDINIQELASTACIGGTIASAYGSGISSEMLQGGSYML